jgi:tRNA (cytidine32/uridine32-2'-O)-methyltransferase
VIGCSARPRKFPHSLLEARPCAERLIEETASGAPAALVFGPERTGLANQDLDLCTFQLQIPANPGFSSLNLAAAVQLVCYELFLAARDPSTIEQTPSELLPSSQSDMEYFFEHLRRALDSRHFLEGEMGEITMTKLRRLFGRARPNAGEVKMLRTLTRLIHRDGD